jgi:dTDP-4-dehydrorhamnose reductase
MRILIIGGAGMLGHRLWRELNHDHETWVTLRQPVERYRAHGLFDPARAVIGVDASNPESLESAFAKVRPEAVVNCVGIIKQLKEAHDPMVSIGINSLLPHRLSRLCAVAGARLVHISTDCVFNGRKGGYTEDDPSDAEDLYGRSKFLGEVHDAHAVTIRTSIIGRELETKSGLIEWFLSQQGRTIKGYRHGVFSGFTTHELARVIRRVLERHRDIGGLWQVSSAPIGKLDLLELARREFAWKGEIVPDDQFRCDRSLDSSRFRKAVGYTPPSWQDMIAELARAA